MQTSPKRSSPIDLRRLVGSVNQLRFNDNKGEVAFFGQKMIILRRDFLRVMREGLERMVGDQAAPFLSYLASGVGVHEGSIFRDSVQTEGEQARLELESLVHTAFEDTNLGWGKIRVAGLNFAKGTADVTIANCFEALENGNSDTANCMFTSGFLAGLFAEVFDRTVQANELKCISQGAAACEFHIIPSDAEGESVASRTEQGKTPAAQPSQPFETKSAVDKSLPTSAPGKAEKQDKPTPPSISGVATEKRELSGKPAASSSSPSSPKSAQSDYDAGVESASRIAQRKESFWKRHFGKKE